MNRAKSRDGGHVCARRLVNLSDCKLKRSSDDFRTLAEFGQGLDRTASRVAGNKGSEKPGPNEEAAADESCGRLTATDLLQTVEIVMPIHYLEIVAQDVDAVCAAYSAANNMQFGEPEAALGNARTAKSEEGYTVGVRAPMHESEEPVVRPYWLVDDIESAVAAAVDAGAEVAHPPLEIPGQGKFAIYILGDVHHGLWQV